MKPIFLLTAALLLTGTCLVSFPSCSSREEPVVPEKKTAADENEEKPEEKDARLSRLGQTPVICAYLTEYTTDFPTEADIRCFTHINYGHGRFVNKETGEGIEIAKPEYLRKLAAFKSTYPELKILLMIGGWGPHANGFSMMARDAGKRKAFCEECARICKEYGIDGIDLDWEYPTYAAEGNGADPSDTKNFTTLMKELREALGEDKLISYAVSSSGKYIDNKAVLEYVDYINVMTYSMGDPPYHNSPLYRSELTRSRSGEESIEIFHSQGVPYDRMNYGMGFYGHGDKDIYPSSVTYSLIADIFEKGICKGKSVAGYNIRYWDDVGKNCYLGDATGKMYASYEDVESLGYRVTFLKKKGMLGAFAWEYREDDAKGTLRHALRDLMDGKTVENSYPGSGTPVTPSDDEPFYAAETDTSPAPTGPFTDLGAKGTANSYVVSAPGSYRFKAVKGNGNASVGAVAGARLVWETGNTAEAVARFSRIESVGVDNGYITFKTPSALVPGNALIAAMDGNGCVLWSWHIWIPATSIGTDTYGLSSYPMMSRNLGALVDAEAGTGPVDARSLGLHYQWGRKDPFPGAGTTGRSETAAVAGIPTTLSGGQMSLARTIARPTVFAGCDGDWNTVSDGDLWGDKSGGKSIYDPCPPGYRVPKREDATGLFRTNLVEAEGWEYCLEGSWFKAGNPAAVFPLPGYIDSDGRLAGAGSRTDLWNAHHDGDVPGKAYGQYLYEGPTSKISAQTKARGGSVRCISETMEAFSNAAGMPVMGSYTKYTLPSTIVELSGLCLKADKSAMWGVGDQGGLYTIHFDGTASQVWYHDADMEGVTIHPSTGDLYVAIEGSQKVYRIPSPGYNTYSTVFYVQEAIDGNFGNGGLEGITYYKDDLLYIGSQSGATLWTYTLSGEKKSKIQLGTRAPAIIEVAGLYYDQAADLLWVTDSDARKLFVFKGDASKLLAMYDVSFIGNAESVCVDHAHSCVWVGSDESTCKLYKISFSGL